MRVTICTLLASNLVLAGSLFLSEVFLLENTSPCLLECDMGNCHQEKIMKIENEKIENFVRIRKRE
jgi:hypothetical protein